MTAVIFVTVFFLEPNDGDGVVAFDKSGLKILFKFDHEPSTSIISIALTAINLSSNTFTNFVFQAAVPKVR